MKIFEKRPLSLILCIMLGGFSLFAFSDIVFKAVLIISASVFLAVILIVKALREKIMLKLCISLLLASFIFSYFYFDVCFYKETEDEGEIVAQVQDIEVKSYVKTLTVRTESINGNSLSTNLIVYCYDKDTYIPVGASVKFTGKIEAFREEENFDFDKYYTSRGISGFSECEKITIVEKGQEPLSYKLKLVRLSISKYINKLTDNESGGLLSALLLGERELMEDGLKLDFTRMGITHILALSGMHIALLVAAIGVILKLLKIDKRINIIVCIIFCLGFMALTGFPYSVCRAGLMLIVSSVLYLITGCKDNITSLSIATSIIVILEPYAVLDVGLWLSVFATFGILIYSEMSVGEYDNSPIIIKLLKSLLSGVIVSVFAVAATSLISAFTFSGISTVSIIATLFFGFLTQWYIYFGLVILAIGGIAPIGGGLIYFYNVIEWFSDGISALPFVYYSSEYVPVKILAIITTALCLFFAVFKIEKRRIFIGVIALSLLITYTVSGVLTEFLKTEDSVLYSENDGDRLLINSGGKNTLIEISDYREGDVYNSVAFLENSGVSALDTYLVMGYSYTLLESIPALCAKIKVSEVRLPTPDTEREFIIAEEIYNVCADFQIPLRFYDGENGFTVGVMKLIPAFRSVYGEGALVCGFIIRKDDAIYSYVSRGAFEHSENAEELLFVSNGLIIGSYGRNYTKSVIIDDKAERLKTLIVNDKSIIIDEALSRSEGVNIEFYKRSLYFIR